MTDLRDRSHHFNKKSGRPKSAPNRGTTTPRLPKNHKQKSTNAPTKAGALKKQ